MKTSTLCGIAACLFTAFAATSASAQDRAGLGVGIEALLPSDLNVPGLASLTYDTGDIYASGLLGFGNVDDVVTDILLGARAYMPIHDGDRADFSVGGGLLLAHSSPADDMLEADTSFYIEAGGRLRAWLNGNVALTSGLGLAIVVADEGGGAPDSNSFTILGNLMGDLGVTYFFW